MWKTSTSRISGRLRGTPFPKCLNTSTNKLNQEPLKDPLYQKPLQSPAPKSKSSLGKIVGFTVTAGLTGTVGYAWYDSDFRKYLETNVPYAKETFGFLFPYLPDRKKVFGGPENRCQPWDKPSPSTPSMFNPPAHSSSSPSEGACGKCIPLVGQMNQTPVKDEKKPPKEKPVGDADRIVAVQSAKQLIKEKEAELASENAALEVALENLIDLGFKLVEQAIKSQDQLIKVTQKHTKELRTAMEDSSTSDKDQRWKSVSEAYQDWTVATRTTGPLVESARETIDKLRSTIEEGKKNPVTKNNKGLRSAQESLTKMLSNLSKSTAEVSKAEAEGKVMMRYKDLVAEGKDQFRKELESIMPAVKQGGHKQGRMTEDELNSLVAHAHRRIEQLQKQMAQQLVMEQQRIQQALEQQKQEDEQLAEKRISSEKERLTSEFELQKHHAEQAVKEEYEQELLHELSRQAAAHSEHLKDVLRVQREELGEIFQRDLQIAILAARQNFDNELMEYIQRMKGIEAAIDARAEMERIAKRAQDVWLACVALNGAINFGNEEGKTWEEKLQPLGNEIVAIADAGQNHPFIEMIIKSMPKEAYGRGVWTEESLKERFGKVKTICRRVAMIDESGGTLFKYFLSFVQSFFVFDTVYAKSEEDMVDPEKLDTFTILAHTQYFLDKGNLELAVRFMNQLEGEPKRVAADWIKEAIILLETRQSADTLMAFASASGLGTIF